MDNSSKHLHCLPLERSFEVTRGHQLSFANNFWSKRDRDVGLVSVRSSRAGESTDMQYDPFRSSRDLGLTWPEVKLWPWPFNVILYMVRRVLRNKHDGIKIIALSKKKLKILSPINRFGKFWNFDPWWPQFWPEPKNDRNDFEMIFCELSNATFRFSLRRPEAEIMGGVQTPPPPPAGDGKSRGPVWRGLMFKKWPYMIITSCANFGFILWGVRMGAKSKCKIIFAIFTYFCRTWAKNEGHDHFKCVK